MSIFLLSKESMRIQQVYAILDEHDTYVLVTNILRVPTHSDTLKRANSYP